MGSVDGFSARSSHPRFLKLYRAGARRVYKRRAQATVFRGLCPPSLSYAYYFSATGSQIS